MSLNVQTSSSYQSPGGSTGIPSMSPETSPRSILTRKFKHATGELMKAASPHDPWVILQGPPNRSIGTSPRSRAQSIVSDTSSSTSNHEAVLQHHTDDNMSSSSFSANKMNGPHPPRDQSPRSVSSPTSKEMSVDYVLSVFGGSGSPRVTPKSTPKNKDHRPAELSTFNADSFSKLHTLCAANTSIEMIRIYTSTYPWALKQHDLHGDLPLHVAIKRDEPSHMIISELLLKCPETAQMKDINGEIPLFLACRRPKIHVGILRALLQVYPAAARLKMYGNTALHHLLHTGCATPENVKLLLAYHHEAVYTVNNFGNLPLHYLCASERPHVMTVRAVLSAYPAGITTLNKSGETPIERALGKQNDEEMRERVRIMLRASHPSALNAPQKDLLRLLNWEARRMIILLCVELARRNYDSHQSSAASGSGQGECEKDELIIRGDQRRCKGLLDMYHSCDGVWRYIIAYL